MPASFTLVPQELDVLGEEFGLRLRRFPFDVPHFGATGQQRRDLREKVLAEVERRGLTERGRPEPDVEFALGQLSRSPLSIAVSGMVDVDSSTMLAVLVTSNGRSGVVADYQAERGMRVHLFDSRGLPRVAAEVLPEHPAGRGSSATVSRPAPVHSRPEEDEESGWLRPGLVAAGGSGGGGRQGDIRRANEILSNPMLRVGQFLVTGHDERGEQLRLPSLGWFDTEAGRFTTSTRTNQDGQKWVTYAPADPAKIAGQLSERLQRFQRG